MQNILINMSCVKSFDYDRLRNDSRALEENLIRSDNKNPKNYNKNNVGGHWASVSGSKNLPHFGFGNLAVASCNPSYRPTHSASVVYFKPNRLHTADADG